MATAHNSLTTETADVPFHARPGVVLDRRHAAACGVETAASMTDVRKAYVRGRTVTPVLDGVDLDIYAGECLFLVGPSGSGKSTLLSILGCILTPDAGDVRILNHDLRRLSPDARTRLRRDHIGFVFQRFQLVRGLNALDNVAVPLKLQGLSPRKTKKRVLHLLERVGMADKAYSLPKNLSAGQCQRIALARALVNDPHLVLADEPTASLDEKTGHQSMQLLHQLVKEQGKTAVVVTHDPRIYEYADRICHVTAGRLQEIRGSSMASDNVPAKTNFQSDEQNDG